MLTSLAFGALGLPAIGVLDFFEDFGFLALILSILMLYNRLTSGFIKNPMLALLVVALVTFTLLIPYPWFKWLTFVVVVMHGFWGEMAGGGH